MQLARLTDCPEIAMSPDEARTFLQSWQNYLRHFSIGATQRTIDLVTAVSVTGFMYVPRAVAVSRRRHAPQQQPRQPGPAQVFTFVPNSTRGAAAPPVQAAAPPPPPPPPQEPPADMTYEPETAAE